MTLKEAIEQTNREKPTHAFSEETLTAWVNELEGYVQSEVMLLDTVRNLTKYTWEDNQNTEMMIRPPHDRLYVSWLEAKIDYKNGEYDKAENSFTVYNEQMTEFKIWFIDHYHPAGVGGRC